MVHVNVTPSSVLLLFFSHLFNRKLLRKTGIGLSKSKYLLSNIINEEVCKINRTSVSTLWFLSKFYDSYCCRSHFPVCVKKTLKCVFIYTRYSVRLYTWCVCWRRWLKVGRFFLFTKHVWVVRRWSQSDPSRIGGSFQKPFSTRFLPSQSIKVSDESFGSVTPGLK